MPSSLLPSGHVATGGHRFSGSSFSCWLLFLLAALGQKQKERASHAGADSASFTQRVCHAPVLFLTNMLTIHGVKCWCLQFCIVADVLHMHGLRSDFSRTLAFIPFTKAPESPDAQWGLVLG